MARAVHSTSGMSTPSTLQLAGIHGAHVSLSAAKKVVSSSNNCEVVSKFELDTPTSSPRVSWVSFRHADCGVLLATELVVI